MSNPIPVYVLNDFLKFERKMYSLFGVNLGRSIQFKTITYFVVTAAALFFLSMIPIIGAPFAAIPVLVKIGIAGGTAYLLTDVGTENRPPLNAFVSFCRYHYQASQRHTYYRGKVLTAPQPVRFGRGIQVKPKEQLLLPAPPVEEEESPLQFKKGVTVFENTN